MRELLTQVMRTPPFYQPGNIRGQRVGIGPDEDEQVDMIGLNCHLNHRPVVFRRYPPNDLFQAGGRCAWGQRPTRTLRRRSAPPLGTADDVGHHEVYTVLLVVIVHVDA